MSRTGWSVRADPAVRSSFVKPNSRIVPMLIAKQAGSRVDRDVPPGPTLQDLAERVPRGQRDGERSHAGAARRWLVARMLTSEELVAYER